MSDLRGVAWQLAALPPDRRRIAIMDLSEPQKRELHNAWWL